MEKPTSYIILHFKTDEHYLRYCRASSSRKRNIQNEGWQRNQIEKTAAQCVEYIKRLTAKNNIFNILSLFFLAFLFRFFMLRLKRERAHTELVRKFVYFPYSCLFHVGCFYALLHVLFVVFCSVGFLARFGVIERCLF